MKAVHADAARTHTLASFTYDAGGNRLLKVAYATDGTTPRKVLGTYAMEAAGVLSYTHVDECCKPPPRNCPLPE
ncbi:MAG: hypothetical protein IPH60_08765 [Flavobacteriales bacterium]|nr:hypothetical protein [Flavobacteriales bacterium]